MYAVLTETACLNRNAQATSPFTHTQSWRVSRTPKVQRQGHSRLQPNADEQVSFEPWNPETNRVADMVVHADPLLFSATLKDAAGLKAVLDLVDKDFSQAAGNQKQGCCSEGKDCLELCVDCSINADQ